MNWLRFGGHAIVSQRPSARSAFCPRSSVRATATIAALDRQRRLSLDQLLGCQRRDIAAAGGYRLAGIGIPGEIVHTPGHSDHCVTLLLDDGSAFTGDLPPEDYSFDNPTALASWEMLRCRGAGMVYPAHGPVRPLGGPSLPA